MLKVGYNNKPNKHGFELGDTIEFGGIEWAVIQTDKTRIKCISSGIIERRAFNTSFRPNRNNYYFSDLRKYLNGGFIRRLIDAGAPINALVAFGLNLRSEDGEDDYMNTSCCDRINLITCDEYRNLREFIPPIKASGKSSQFINGAWWTATPVRIRPRPYTLKIINQDGSLDSRFPDDVSGVRPTCCLNTQILSANISKKEKRRKQVTQFVKKIVADWNIGADELYKEKGEAHVQ